MKKILFVTLLLCCSFIYAETHATQKLTLILDWFPNPNHAPIIIAKENGFFKEQGLEVTLIAPSDPTDPPKWIAAKKVDIGISYEPQMMEHIDRGLPLIRIGTLIDRPLNCLVSLAQSEIKSLADLKGKRIGSSSGGLTNLMLNVMLAQHHLTTKDIELINVRYNLTQALLAGKVDMVTGMMRNFEVPQLELANQAVQVFYPEDHGIPMYSELIFIVHPEHINHPALAKFLRAVKNGVQYIKQHPQESWQQFAKKYPESNNELNRRAWFDTLKYFANEPAYFDPDQWQQFAQFMYQQGLIKKVASINTYAVNILASNRKG